MAKLTPKQKLFIKEYVVDKNATQAAIRAGYSKNRAAEIGSQNYRKLQEYIDAEIDKQLAKIDITEQKVLQMLVDDHDKSVKNKQMSPAVRCAELLGKYRKMFADRVEHTGTINANVNVNIVPCKKK